MQWKFTFEPRTIRIHMIQVLENNISTLKIHISSQQHRPVSLDICRESRALALQKYSTLLTSNASQVESVLRSSYSGQFDNVKIIGFLGERIDFESDTLMLVNFKHPTSPAPSLMSLVSGDKVKKVLWSRSVSLRQHRQISWRRVAAYFPNLDEFNLVFGEYNWAPTQQTNNGQCLLPMDSNLVDLFHFYHFTHSRRTRSLARNYAPLINGFSLAETCKESFLGFVMESTAPEKWSKMKFSMNFWTEDKCAPKVLAIGWTRVISQLRDLPRFSRSQWKDQSFPTPVRFRLDVCDEDEELLSRYDGMSLLFREES